MWLRKKNDIILKRERAWEEKKNLSNSFTTSTSQFSIKKNSPFNVTNKKRLHLKFHYFIFFFFYIYMILPFFPWHLPFSKNPINFFLKKKQHNLILKLYDNESNTMW